MSDDLLTQARRTVPTLTDEQWTAWLAQVERLGGAISLPFDGGPVCATYPRAATACPQISAAIDGAIAERPSAAGESR